MTIATTTMQPETSSQMVTTETSTMLPETSSENDSVAMVTTETSTEDVSLLETTMNPLANNLKDGSNVVQKKTRFYC